MIYLTLLMCSLIQTEGLSINSSGFLFTVGWYIIWVAFLSRFKLMRELLSIGDGSEKKKSEPSDSRNSSRSSPRKPIGKRSQPARWWSSLYCGWYRSFLLQTLPIGDALVFDMKHIEDHGRDIFSDSSFVIDMSHTNSYYSREIPCEW